MPLHALTVIIASLLFLGVQATPVQATPTSDSADFYQPPGSLPPHNGDLVRTQPSAFYLDPARTLAAPAKITRVMYRSTDHTGTPVAVTGTVLVPSTPWPGEGARPLVGYAVGAQGVADDCAPSRQLAAGSEYEGAMVSALLARGYAVAVTDYRGLGPPGLHTFMNRADQGHAVLDSLRAAASLPGAGLSDGPLAIVGYSQGGAAAASAAELAPSYAPELDLVGVAAGAVAADLPATATYMDGSMWSWAIGYALLGLGHAYDVDPHAFLDDRGDATLDRLRHLCTVEAVAQLKFTRWSNHTADGSSLGELFDRKPWRSILAAQRLAAGRAPQVPVLVSHSLLEDAIPYRPARAAAERWCAQGAPVRFSTNSAPGHIGGAVPFHAETLAFLTARFADQPVQSNCPHRRS